MQNSEFEFFKNFPVSAIGNVWQFLPYKDAQNFRRTSISLSHSYYDNRHVIQGPICDVIIESDYKVYINNIHVENKQCLVNLNCTNLTIKTGEIDIVKLQSIVKSWKIDKLQFFGLRIDDEILRYFDIISKSIEIHTKTFKTSEIPTSKLKYLEVTEPLYFFTLNAILRNNPELNSMKISTTIASIPTMRKILQNNWENLECWEITLEDWNFGDDTVHAVSDRHRISVNEGILRFEKNM